MIIWMKLIWNFAGPLMRKMSMQSRISGGTVGILYNTEMVDEEVDSWDILWDEKYANQIIMENSMRDAFEVPLKWKGKSLNTVDEE